jgi:hypothetical protein
MGTVATCSSATPSPPEGGTHHRHRCRIGKPAAANPGSVALQAVGATFGFASTATADSSAAALFPAGVIVRRT